MSSNLLSLLQALLRHARPTHRLAAHMSSNLLSLLQALLSDGADVVAHLLPTAEVGPVPVHTVCEAASMLTCVSCKLVLLPVARVPAELSAILYHLLSASITVPVESLRLGDLLVCIARFSSAPGHQVVLLPGSAVSQSLRILLHHFPASCSVPHESLRSSCRPFSSLLFGFLNCPNSAGQQQLPIVARLCASLCVELDSRLVCPVPDEPFAGCHPCTAGRALDSLLVALVLLQDKELLIVAAS